MSPPVTVLKILGCSMNQAVALQNSGIQKNTIESLAIRYIEGLKETEEQVFAKIVGEQYGFSFSNRWEMTTKYILDDLKSSEKEKCTLSNLEILVDRVIASANHHYYIYQTSKEQHASVYQQLKALVGIDIANAFSIAYPKRVSFDEHPELPLGHHLCKVSDLGDGICCVYAYVTKEKVNKFARAVDSAMQKVQYYNCVFVPRDYHRFELRVTDKIASRGIEDAMYSLRIEFLDSMHTHDIKLSAENYNFYQCIEKVYKDKSIGRVAHAILTTEEDSNDAELKGIRNKRYCARTQTVADTQNQHKYVCRAIKIRAPYSKGKHEVEYCFFPHKNAWELKYCMSMQIVKPENSIMLQRIIEDSIKILD